MTLHVYQALSSVSSLQGVSSRCTGAWVWSLYAAAPDSASCLQDDNGLLDRLRRLLSQGPAARVSKFPHCTGVLVTLLLLPAGVTVLLCHCWNLLAGIQQWLGSYSLSEGAFTLSFYSGITPVAACRVQHLQPPQRQHDASLRAHRQPAVPQVPPWQRTLPAAQWDV